MVPSSPIRTLAFQMQPTLSAVPSLKPSDTKTRQRRATRPIRSSSGPGQRRVLAASRRNQSWLASGDCSADHTGKAGMYVSGNATSWAPCRAASSITAHALSTVLSRSRNTGATCAAATR